MLDSDLGASITLDNAASIVNLHPAGYAFRDFDELLPVSVGGYALMDLFPLQGFIGLNGSE